MQAFAARLPKGANVVFGTSREQQFNLHSAESYTGSVLTALGLTLPASINNAPMAAIGLEQLLAINPEWLIVAHYRQQSIVRTWQQDPLWQVMQAAQKQQIAEVDSNTWARMRGIFAAERIGEDMVKIVHHQTVTVNP